MALHQATATQAARSTCFVAHHEFGLGLGVALADLDM